MNVLASWAIIQQKIVCNFCLFKSKMTFPTLKAAFPHHLHNHNKPPSRPIKYRKLLICIVFYKNILIRCVTMRRSYKNCLASHLNIKTHTITYSYKSLNNYYNATKSVLGKPGLSLKIRSINSVYA